ncbi:MAG: MFS transporter [Candidatus Brocadiaceae bacterium]|jgi:PPP family 3-phenylpropionic acid transporter
MVRFSLHYFVLFAVFATVWPYFPAFLRSLGFSEAHVGYLQGLRMLAGVGGPLLVAWLSDRLGRRRLLIAASLIAFVLLIVPLASTSDFLPAALLAMGVGLALRTTIPLSDTLAATELRDPAHQYGKVRVWGSMGFISTLFAIRLFGLVDEQSAGSMMRAMLIAALAGLVVSRFLPERHKPPPGPDAAAGEGRGFDALFWVFIGVVALQQLGMSGYYAFFTIYLQDELGMQQAAWVWAVASASEMPVLICAGLIIRRFGVFPMLLMACAAVSVRLAVYSLFPVLWAVLPAQLLHAAAFGMLHAAAIETIRRRAPAGRRAVAMSLYMSLAVALPLLVGSSIGGLVIERFGYLVLYGVYAVPPLLGMVLLAAAGRGLAERGRAP